MLGRRPAAAEPAATKATAFSPTGRPRPAPAAAEAIAKAAPAGGRPQPPATTAAEDWPNIPPPPPLEACGPGPATFWLKLLKRLSPWLRPACSVAHGRWHRAAGGVVLLPAAAGILVHVAHQRRVRVLSNLRRPRRSSSGPVVGFVYVVFGGRPPRPWGPTAPAVSVLREAPVVRVVRGGLCAPFRATVRRAGRLALRG